MDEKEYSRGQRSALVSMLKHCCRELGYNDEHVSKSGWIAERESAISTLRSICEDHGDNNWDDGLHLSDILCKHLDLH
jgi:hypothetical protein